MLKKYSVLLCVVVSVALFLVASLLYPGGAILDKNSVGILRYKRVCEDTIIFKPVTCEV
jgi:hypothetical protein